MSYAYEMIGRAVVAIVWARFGRQIRIAAVAFAVVAAAIVYLVGSRDVEEG